MTKTEHYHRYQSPIGEIILTGHDEVLTGLWFNSQRHQSDLWNTTFHDASLPIFEDAKRWLDQYFSGLIPEFTPRLEIHGSAFRVAVCELMLAIPYGQTTTYGAIAREIAHLRHQNRMSAQAVGGAVGHNPISLIIPCHRVIGSDGSLTGYGGGLDRKRWLLELERRSTQ